MSTVARGVGDAFRGAMRLWWLLIERQYVQGPLVSGYISPGRFVLALTMRIVVLGLIALLLIFLHGFVDVTDYLSFSSWLLWLLVPSTVFVVIFTLLLIRQYRRTLRQNHGGASLRGVRDYWPDAWVRRFYYPQPHRRQASVARGSRAAYWFLFAVLLGAVMVLSAEYLSEGVFSLLILAVFPLSTVTVMLARGRDLAPNADGTGLYYYPRY